VKIIDEKKQDPDSLVRSTDPEHWRDPA